MTVTTAPPYQEILQHSKCLITLDKLHAALDSMAEKMNEVLVDSNPVVLPIVVGGIVTAGQLLPRLNFAMQCDYIHVTRYRGETSGGQLYWKVTPTIDLKNRTIVLVDDILDGGITLKAAVDYCKSEGAEDVKTAVLLDKTDTRDEKGLKKADFVGLNLSGDPFVFGFGLDGKDGYLRNAPGIFELPDQYK